MTMPAYTNLMRSFAGNHCWIVFNSCDHNNKTNK